MKSLQLLRLATAIARNSRTMLVSHNSLAEFRSGEYWHAAKKRLTLLYGSFQSALAERDADEAQIDLDNLSRKRNDAVAFLLSEPLIRVWTAFVVGYEQFKAQQRHSTTVINIWRNHLEVRNAMLRLLVDDGGFDNETFLELNRLRRRIERWTDLLLARILHLVETTEFAFDHQRVEEFSEVLCRGGQQTFITEDLFSQAFPDSLESANSSDQLNGLNEIIFQSLEGIVAQEARQSTSVVEDWTTSFRNAIPLRLDSSSRSIDELIRAYLEEPYVSNN